MCGKLDVGTVCDELVRQIVDAVNEDPDEWLVSTAAMQTNVHMQEAFANLRRYTRHAGIC